MSPIAFVVTAIGFLALGGGIGAGIAWATARRGQSAKLTASDLKVAHVLDLVVRDAESGIVVVDQHRDVIVHNRRAGELGVVRDQLLVDRAWQAAQRCLVTGERVECDLSGPRLLGMRERLLVRGVARRVRPDIEGPGPKLVVIFAHDDSEHVRMEATRRDFVANVSHELKTPVGAMSVLAEALLESVDDPESVTHFGERVLAEARRMGKLVTELIALSRLQGAERLPDLEVVEVDDVVAEAVDRVRTVAEAAEITLRTDAPSGLEVMGDATLLITALVNLVQNAIAYSPKGSPVSVSRTLRGSVVQIAVTDRGIGIAKEDQERVFERFFRVDKARSRATGGTGLGLAIAKHVAANHNGEISLWSRLGTGSTFTLHIPVLGATGAVGEIATDDLDGHEKATSSTILEG